MALSGPRKSSRSRDPGGRRLESSKICHSRRGEMIPTATVSLSGARKSRSSRSAGSFEKGGPEGPKSTPEPRLLQDRLWAALGALLGRPLGSSWDLLGRSRPLLGRSWGSLWPPGGAFFAVFTCFFGGLARGVEKNDDFVVFVVFFVCCVGSLFEPRVPSSRCPRQAREH